MSRISTASIRFSRIAILGVILPAVAHAGRCDPEPPLVPAHNALFSLDAFEEVAGVSEEYSPPSRYVDPDSGLGCPDDGIDRQKSYVTVLTDASWPASSRWRMWYSGYDGDYWPMYAESSDGLAWVRPEVGQVGVSNAFSFSGLDEANGQVMQVLYDGAQYVAVQGTENAGGWTTSHKIWSSTGPVGPWSLEADLDPEYPHRSASGPGHGMALVQLNDTSWVSYAQCWRCDGSGQGIRSIAAYTAPNLAGPWTYQGVVIPGLSVDDQRHGITVQRVGDDLVGFVESYDDSPLRAGPLYLVTSSDGLTWDDPGRLFIDYGGIGDPDEAMIFKGSVAGDYAYHTGCPTNVIPCLGSVVVSDVDLGRLIGYSATSGHLLTHEFTPVSNSRLYLNADATGGSLRVGVIHPFTGDELSGFEASSFDVITSDIEGVEATWGGQPLPLGQSIKLRFELADAALYAYQVSP